MKSDADSKRSDAPQDQLPILRPLRGAADLQALQAAAAEDGHMVVTPDYVVEKRGQIVGSIGLNSLPLMRVWFHTEQVRPRDTVLLVNAVENLCRLQGMKHLAALVRANSPFAPVAERLGYQHLSDVQFKLKLL